MQITECTPPEGTLLAAYVGKDAHHVDCFEAAVDHDPTLPALIAAFYTQPLFQAERLVLRVAAGARSSDDGARALARGETDRFAVWTVQDRRDHEILLADTSGRTMSWLGVGAGVARFGSVVVPVRDRRGRLTLGPVFHSLLGAHRVYSRALLAGAVRRLGRG